jgi:hypothetical protein
VYYKGDGMIKFASHATEEGGYIVGISEHYGHALTWKILTTDTNVVIVNAIVRPFTTIDINLCAELVGGEKFSETGPNMDPITKKQS